MKKIKTLINKYFDLTGIQLKIIIDHSKDRSYILKGFYNDEEEFEYFYNDIESLEKDLNIFLDKNYTLQQFESLLRILGYRIKKLEKQMKTLNSEYIKYQFIIQRIKNENI